MFDKKIYKDPLDVEDAQEAVVPVFFGGQQIGEVIHIKAKEIGGLDHIEIWLKLAFGSGLEPQMRDVIVKQGIYLGKPPE